MTVKCETILFSPVNGRTLRLTGRTKVIKVHTFDNKIISLELPNNKVISSGESITVKKRQYKINIIEKVYKGNVLVYDLLIASPTKSNVFLLPMLTGERKLYFYDSHLINVFIGTPDQDNCIALLYRWSKDPLFLKFEAALKQFRNFIDYTDYGNNLVLYIFDVPLRHQENYNLYKEGKYSELNTDYKTQILKFHGMEAEGQIGQILFKSEKRKKRLETMLKCDLEDDAELYSILDLSVEVFNPKIYL
tara:strand:- start:1835 stop:2578 length:744 start_codon:yes stop_codon:yes gene_type:complete